MRLSLLLLCLLSLAACNSETQKTAGSPTPPGPPPPAEPLGKEQPVATEPAPPPPPGPASASNPTATPSVAAPADAQPNADGDPLAAFRFDESGKRLNDLEALQAAVWTYERMASLSPDEGQQPLPGLTDLNALVKARLITAVPEAPGGKRYIVNAANKQVSIP